MLTIITKVLVVFIYMAVGIACNKLRILPIESTKYLTALLIMITAPCMLFDSILSKELTDGMMGNTLIALFGATLLYAVFGMICLYGSIRLKFRHPNEISVAMVASNNGFMGLPVTLSSFGNGEIFYYLIVENVSINFYLYIFSLFQLKHGIKREKNASLFETIRPMIKPVTVVPIIATIMLFAGIKIPAYPMEIISTIGGITVPLSMIVVGVQFAESDISKLVRDKALMMTSLTKLVLIPAVTLGLVMLLPFCNELRAALVITMIFPTSVSSAALAQYYGCDSQTIAEAVAHTTLFSLFTIPVWIIILTELFV